MSERKQRKDKGKQRNFRLFIRSTTTGHCTKGRYYTHGSSVWDRMKALSLMLTDKHEIVAFRLTDRVVVKQITGKMRHRPEMMSIFSPVQVKLSKK